VEVDSETRLKGPDIKQFIDDTQPLLRERHIAPISREAIQRRQRESAGLDPRFAQPATFGLALELVEMFSNTVAMPLKQKPVKGPKTPKPQQDVLPPPILTPPPVLPPERPPEDFHFDPQLEPIEVSVREEREKEGLELVPVTSVSARTIKILQFLHGKLVPPTAYLIFRELVQGKRRKTVAGTFFELLVLKSKDRIQVEQSEPFGDIIITKGKNFDIAM